MLRNQRDVQALAYLLAQPLLVAWQWRHGWSLPLYALQLFLTLGVGVIHHHHAHLPLWRHKRLNRWTDGVLSVLQGHPTFVFHVAHNANHHRHVQGPLDVTRTYRFGGDHNHLWGYLLHPVQAAWVLVPVFVQWLSRLRHHHRGAWRHVMQQYAAVLTLWGVLAALDWRLWLLLVLAPQLHGLHWLLATNYLQHAHADGHSRLQFARNFEGWVNPLLFNIGLHTAHHLHPRVHWSALPVLHAGLRPRLHPSLLAGGLLGYMFKTYLLSLLWPRWRSQTLMHHHDR